MPSLKDLRSRVSSVKSTKKITSAMKMVAASKLRKAQTAVEEARPYALHMEHMVSSLASTLHNNSNVPKLLSGGGNDDVHMLVIFTSDRGLCGGFNSNIVRETRQRIQHLQASGKKIKLYCVGRKGGSILKREYGHLIVEQITGTASKAGINFSDAQKISCHLLDIFERGDFDICTIIYNTFQSAIHQSVTPQQIIPFYIPPEKLRDNQDKTKDNNNIGGAVHEYEPSEEAILATLPSTNLSVQIYRAMLESYASEQGARMSSMDNATRNANDMINNLTLTYNRTRQTHITTELIEIISGAEAL